MKAWVLKSPNELELKTKVIPIPGYSEVLVKTSSAYQSGATPNAL